MEGVFRNLWTLNGSLTDSSGEKAERGVQKMSRLNREAGTEESYPKLVISSAGREQKPARSRWRGLKKERSRKQFN